jgi:hypothetical protein
MVRKPTPPARRGFAAAAAVGLVFLAILTGPARRVGWAAGGQLEVTVVDRQTGEPIPCRMHLRNAAGRPRKAKNLPFWHDHFVLPGKITLKLPVGNYFFELERGPEYVVRSGHFTIDPFADDAKEVDLFRFVDMSAHGWWSGDLEVRRPARDIELLMAADDLHVVPLLTWSDGKTEWAGKSPPDEPLVRFDGNRYCHMLGGGHTWAGGTLLCFNLPAPLEPDASGPEYPPPATFLDEVRKSPEAWVDLSRPFWWDLPMLVALDRIDSIQVAHAHLCRNTVIDHEAAGKPRDKALYPGTWGNARWSQAIYFHLLNCGLRIPPTAGSGSGVAPNPVGYNRVYVHVDGEFSYEKWWENLRAGRVTITNGPLLRPRVEGRLPGHCFHADEGKSLELEIGLTLSTRQPISYLELIKNGRIEHSIRFDEYATSGKLPKLQFDQSGWFLVRAVTDLEKTYRFAMTGPYYVEIGYQPRISKRSARFFLDWVYERARQIELDDPARRREVIDYHRQARDFWQDLVSRANAE